MLDRLNHLGVKIEDKVLVSRYVKVSCSESDEFIKVYCRSSDSKLGDLKRRSFNISKLGTESIIGNAFCDFLRLVLVQYENEIEESDREFIIKAYAESMGIGYSEHQADFKVIYPLEWVKLRSKVSVMVTLNKHKLGLCGDSIVVDSPVCFGVYKLKPEELGVLSLYNLSHEYKDGVASIIHNLVSTIDYAIYLYDYERENRW